MSLKTSTHLPDATMLDRQVEQWNARVWRG